MLTLLITTYLVIGLLVILVGKQEEVRYLISEQLYDLKGFFIVIAVLLAVIVFWPVAFMPNRRI